MGLKRAAPALAIALAAALALAFVTASSRLHDEAAAELASAGAALEEEAGLLEGDRCEGLLLLAATDEGDVADPAVIDALRASLQEAGEGLVDADGLAPVAQGTFDWATMLARARVERDMADGLSEAREAMGAAVASVGESRALRAVLDARDELSVVADDAEKLLSSSEGMVADEATRQTLADRLEDARSTLGREATAEDDPAGISSKAEGLRDAMGLVEASEDELEGIRAQQARRAAAASGGSRVAAPSAPSGASGAWDVSYAQGHYVDASGGVTEYFDGYYVAHRSTGTAGSTIASRPATVTVGGVTYRYVSERLAEIGSPYSDIQAWATANGGIAFQTCDYSTGRRMALVLHYEPV